MSLNYWLVKQEPSTYSWDDLMKDGRTSWTGVRNFQARKNLRLMKVGDLALFYHSGVDKSVVGIARVAREAYPDPTAKDGDWSCVDVLPVKATQKPVSLGMIKAEPALKKIALVTHSRLSVMPLRAEEFSRILALGNTGEPS